MAFPAPLEAIHRQTNFITVEDEVWMICGTFESTKKDTIQIYTDKAGWTYGPKYPLKTDAVGAVRISMWEIMTCGGRSSQLK